MQKSHSSVTPKIVGAFVMSAVAFVALYILVFRPLYEKEENTAAPATTQQQPAAQTTDTSISTQTTDSQPEPATTQQATLYADGVYSATVDYVVPKGETNRIVVELTIANGVVTSLSTTNTYEDNESSRYIAGFENAIEASVEDTKFDDISLSRIGGASITTSAFMDALSDIAVKAKS